MIKTHLGRNLLMIPMFYDNTVNARCCPLVQAADTWFVMSNLTMVLSWKGLLNLHRGSTWLSYKRVPMLCSGVAWQHNVWIWLKLGDCLPVTSFLGICFLSATLPFWSILVHFGSPNHHFCLPFWLPQVPSPVNGFLLLCLQMEELQNKPFLCSRFYYLSFYYRNLKKKCGWCACRWRSCRARRLN